MEDASKNDLLAKKMSQFLPVLRSFEAALMQILAKRVSLCLANLDFASASHYVAFIMLPSVAEQLMTFAQS